MVEVPICEVLSTLNNFKDTLSAVGQFIVLPHLTPLVESVPALHSEGSFALIPSKGLPSRVRAMKG